MTTPNLGAGEHRLGQDWSVLSAVKLRAAGLPFDWIETSDTRSADAAMAELEHQREFRLAMRWQNANLPNYPPGGGPRSERRKQKLHRTYWSYASRYCTKNDEIGFFGPVIWASFADQTDAERVGTISESGVYFEHWAVRALAGTLIRRHNLRPWLPVRLAPSAHDRGDVLRNGLGADRPLHPAERALIDQIDGRRTLVELATTIDQAVSEVDALLAPLERAGLVNVGFALPRVLHPERNLAIQLLRIGNAERRTAAKADLDLLVAGRDAVVEAMGDPGDLHAALQRLQKRFEEITDQPSHRRPAEFYAGRSVLFLDCLSGADVRFGREVLDNAGPGLELLLTSARWFTRRVAASYQEWAEERFDAQRGTDGSLPLAVLLSEAADMARWGVESPADTAVAELQERWRGLVPLQTGGREISLSSAELRTAVQTTFACDARAPWALAAIHSPDLLIAARDVEAIRRGDFLTVVGEVHPAHMTLDSATSLQWLPDAERLWAELDDVVGPSRIVPIYPLDSPELNSRTKPPDARMSRHHRYVGVGNDLAYQPHGAEMVPLAALCIVRENGVLVGASEDGRRWPLLELLGDYISHAAATRFTCFAPTNGHVPRIQFDRCVVQRETWTVPLSALADWRDADAAELLSLLPRHVFVIVPGERKPRHLDLENPQSREVIAHAAVRALDRGEERPVKVSEMLPGPADLWLRDDEGRRYTSEFRFTCADLAAVRAASAEGVR